MFGLMAFVPVWFAADLGLGAALSARGHTTATSESAELT